MTPSEAVSSGSRNNFNKENKMKKANWVKIQINLENSAFDNAPAEVARILRKNADKMETAFSTYSERDGDMSLLAIGLLPLYDINGNACGSIEMTD